MTLPLPPAIPNRRASPPKSPVLKALGLGTASLLLGACQLNAAVSPGDISQYLCPNGLTLRLSYNEDRSVMRLGIKGRVNTLRQDAANPALYSNGHYSATLDGSSLRLQTTGILLPQNCRLQIAAANASAGNDHSTPISGSINYRQRRALSPRAVVKIRLEDVTLMDVAAKVIASTTLANPGQVPIRFTLPYDAGKLEAGHRYELQVRIEENDRLLFINTMSHPVLQTPDATRADVWVEPVTAP